MQHVFLWSSVTYECTHVTPSSALVPTTDMQACAPCSVNGISSPSGKERSTMNLAIRNLLAVVAATREGCLPPQAMKARSARHPGEGSDGAQFKCSFLASHVATCTRESNPSLSRMWCTWLSMVRSER